MGRGVSGTEGDPGTGAMDPARWETNGLRRRPVHHFRLPPLWALGASGQHSRRLRRRLLPAGADGDGGKDAQRAVQRARWQGTVGPAGASEAAEVHGDDD